MTASKHESIYQSLNSDQFAQALVARLSEAADNVPHSVSERLKSARALAMDKRRSMATQWANNPMPLGHTAALRGPSNPLWSRIGSLLPLLALVAGLVAISVIQDDMRAEELAEVDAELLTDELPPAAFTDPGFAQFLHNKINP